MDKHDLQLSLQKGNYEETADGILFPETQILARGQFCYHKRGEAPEYSDNLLVDEGRDSLLDVALGGGS